MADWRNILESLEERVAALKSSGGPLHGGDDADVVSGMIARIYAAFAPPGGIRGSCETTSVAIKDAIERCCQVANSAVLDDNATSEEKGRVDAVLQSLYYANQAFSTAVVSSRFAGGGGGGGTDEDLAAGVARFSRMEVSEDTNKMQQLLLYLLNCAQSRGYRRFKGDCYARRFTADGHDTHAWDRVFSLREFVYDATRKELNYEMWLAMTSMRTNVGSAVEHLDNCRDVQLPDLKKDRHVFSFRNGIYLAAKDQFLHYGKPEAHALPADTIAARFFDVEFPSTLDENAVVDTPHLQSILDYQGMDSEVSQWMYVMIGRLIYEVNELDQWQVIPYLKGAASSGKSTILTRVCRGLYEPGDVGVMSNNIERKFGLSALHDKFIFIGPEIKSDMALEQAEFQSVVSGETVQVATKFQTAQAVEWKVPGILAGNEVPGWVDNAGSINRRIVLFEFSRRVDNGDMELGKKLDTEIGAIILKANRAYLRAVRLHARDNIWLHLPRAFHAAKEEFTESVNSLVHFLHSAALDFGGSDVYMPLDDFSREYKAHTERMGMTRVKMTGDSLVQPLLGVQCRLVKKGLMRYPRGEGCGGSVMSGTFVVGADFASRARSGGCSLLRANDGSYVDELGG